MSWIISSSFSYSKNRFIKPVIKMYLFTYMLLIEIMIFILFVLTVVLTIAAVRPYTEEAYEDDTMTVYQVPLFGESRCSSEFYLIFIFL